MTATTYEMNAYQKASFDQFLGFVKYTDNYEVKELNITDSYGDAYVDVTIGLKNDEGTMAECLCRDTYLFFIGKRGGIFQFPGSRKVYRKYYEVEHL